MCLNLSAYIFMVWDGVQFFGTGSVKLDRHRGKKAGWCDRLKDPEIIIWSLMMLAIIVFVALTE